MAYKHLSIKVRIKINPNTVCTYAFPKLFCINNKIVLQFSSSSPVTSPRLVTSNLEKNCKIHISLTSKAFLFVESSQHPNCIYIPRIFQTILRLYSVDH